MEAVLIDDFRRVAEENGFAICDLVVDGEIHRFARDGRSRKKNAWYCAHASRLDKPRDLNGSKVHSFLVVQYGDWSDYTCQGEPNRREYCSLKRQTKQNKDDIRKFRDRAHIKKRAEREKLRKEAAERAQRIWGMTNPAADFAYLTTKKLSSAHGARVNEYDGTRALVIPMRNIDGAIVSCQFIQENGAKKFLRDGELQGTHFLIGEVKPGSRIILCEGFSTGASIAEATGLPVAVTFVASNLKKNARLFADKYPGHKITVCGDDDWGLEAREVNPVPNAGRIAAEAAGRILGTKPRLPKFAKKDPKQTDYNDLHCIEGLDAVRRQLDFSAPELLADDATGFVHLGYDAKGFDYYYVRKTNQILPIKGYTDRELYRLMPLEFWQAEYGRGGKADMEQAKSDLIQKSQDVGLFNPDNVRGIGAWVENNGKVFVVNPGDGTLLVDGEKVAMGDWNESSDYYYIKSKQSFTIPADAPISSEISNLENLVKSFNWRDEISPYLLLGWLFSARIAGGLPIRPHVWLTGPSNSGKSTIMEKIVNRLLSSKTYCQAGSTEAGIRQESRTDSVPVIYDEFEASSTERGNERITNLIELFRNTWSATAGKVFKGGSDGASSSFNLNFAALVSSIVVSLANKADTSRFSVLELDKHAGKYEDEMAIKKMVAAISDDLAEKLNARAIALQGEILQAYDTFTFLLRKRDDGRSAQQIGMLLGSYWLLTHDTAPTLAEAEAFLRDRLDKGFRVEAQVSDEEECFTRIATTQLQVVEFSTNAMGGTVETRVQKTVGQLIAEGDPGKDLIGFGIKLDGNMLYIANNHQFLRTRVFNGSQWESGSWGATLKRIRNSAAGMATRFGKAVSRMTQVPLEGWVKEICEMQLPEFSFVEAC